MEGIKIYTTTTLAKLLEIEKRTIATAIREGKIKAFKRFSKWYITESHVNEYITSSPVISFGTAADDGPPVKTKSKKKAPKGK